MGGRREKGSTKIFRNTLAHSPKRLLSPKMFNLIQGSKPEMNVLKITLTKKKGKQILVWDKG